MEFRFEAKPIFREEGEGENIFLTSKYYKEGFYQGNLITDGAKAYLVNGVVECTEEYMNHEEWVPVHAETVRPLFSTCTLPERAFLDEIRENFEFDFDENLWCRKNPNMLKRSYIYQSDFKVDIQRVVKGECEGMEYGETK